MHATKDTTVLLDMPEDLLTAQEDEEEVTTSCTPPPTVLVVQPPPARRHTNSKTTELHVTPLLHNDGAFKLRLMFLIAVASLALVTIVVISQQLILRHISASQDVRSHHHHSDHFAGAEDGMLLRVELPDSVLLEDTEIIKLDEDSSSSVAWGMQKTLTDSLFGQSEDLLQQMVVNNDEQRVEQVVDLADLL